jgi:hypothetical protein
MTTIRQHGLLPGGRQPRKITSRSKLTQLKGEILEVANIVLKTLETVDKKEIPSAPPGEIR